MGRHEHAVEEGSVRTMGVRATMGGTTIEAHEEKRMRKAAHDRTMAQACEADRARKQERARRAKVAGPDALRKGKYPRCTQWRASNVTHHIFTP